MLKSPILQKKLVINPTLYQNIRKSNNFKTTEGSQTTKDNTHTSKRKLCTEQSFVYRKRDYQQIDPQETLNKRTDKKLSFQEFVKVKNKMPLDIEWISVGKQRQFYVTYNKKSSYAQVNEAGREPSSLKVKRQKGIQTTLESSQKGRQLNYRTNLIKQNRILRQTRIDTVQPIRNCTGIRRMSTENQYRPWSRADKTEREEMMDSFFAWRN